MRIALEVADDAVDAALRNGLHDYNASKASNASWHEIRVTVRDESNVLHGGVIAHLFGESCYIDTVWTDDAVRGSGHGSEMIRMTESEARRLGARGAWLYTTSFQAKPFYEKLGYAQFGELAWPGSDVVRHFMRKEL